MRYNAPVLTKVNSEQFKKTVRPASSAVLLIPLHQHAGPVKTRHLMRVQRPHCFFLGVEMQSQRGVVRQALSVPPHDDLIWLPLLLCHTGTLP